MAPKRKASSTCKTPKRQCIPKPGCCPNVASVPKLLVKGGVEVLSVVTGEDSITQIELYLNPRMGVNSPDLPTTSNWYTYTYDLQPKGSSPDQPIKENLPAYSLENEAIS